MACQAWVGFTKSGATASVIRQLGLNILLVRIKLGCTVSIAFCRSSIAKARTQVGFTRSGATASVIRSLGLKQFISADHVGSISMSSFSSYTLHKKRSNLNRSNSPGSDAIKCKNGSDLKALMNETEKKRWKERQRRPW